MKINIKKGYGAARAADYPTYAEQFDILFHEGYEAWKERIQATKDRFPKEQPD